MFRLLLTLKCTLGTVVLYKHEFVNFCLLLVWHKAAAEGGKAQRLYLTPPECQ